MAVFPYFFGPVTTFSPEVPPSDMVFAPLVFGGSPPPGTSGGTTVPYGLNYSDPSAIVQGSRDFAFDKLDGSMRRSQRNGLTLTSGLEAIRQDVEQRLSLIRGEWFLDNALGFPLFQQVLVKSPVLSAIKALYRDALLETPGVVSVNALDLTFNSQTRKLKVFFSASTDLGELTATL